MSDELPKGKVSKAHVKHLVESGRYTIYTLDGTAITDYKKMFEDIESERGQDSGTIPHIPFIEQTRPSIPEPEPYVKLPPVNPYLVINGLNYTRRQLEHFGDAIVALTTRMMVHELTQQDQRLYFNFTAQLITNTVLGSGNKQRGAEVEVSIGTRFAQSGIFEAIEMTREIISKTEPWENLVRLVKENGH